jgi:Protein of unknown function (DUF1573)
MELKHFNEVNTMKRTLLLSFALMLGLVVYQNASSHNLPPISRVLEAIWKWEKTTHDFGKIEQNKPVTASFEFTNTGDSPLIITKATGSCGCTVPSYPKEPIMPGGTGIITAQFNAAASGTFTKTVDIEANTAKAAQLTITGTVVAAKQ